MGMTFLSPEALTYREAARTLHASDLVKDRRYREFPLGQDVGRFLRAKKAARCRPNTLESYEGVLRRLVLRYPYIDTMEELVADAGERLLDFLEAICGEADEDTVLQRWAVVSSFTAWGFRTDRITADVMQKLERPRRKRGREARRPRVPSAHIDRIVSAAPTTRDQAALLLLGRLGLRREDLRLLQLGDIDLTLDRVALRHGKGGVEHVLPVAFRDLKETLYLHLQERGGHPDEYLLYPKSHRARPFSTAGIDGWFQRCVTRAGLAGYTMHQLRHSAIDDVNRATRDPEAARMLARHASLATTQGYLHSTLDDLRERLQEMGT